jgi:4-carboxymuconolactone decarboxylase
MYERGMKTRREVLGDEHVDRTIEQTTDLDQDFQRWITETAWGGVWSRTDLDRRTRSLVAIAILAALGRNEMRLHIRAARDAGIPPEEVAAVLMHVGVYAGIPAAHTAFDAAKEIYEGSEQGDDDE